MAACPPPSPSCRGSLILIIITHMSVEGEREPSDAMSLLYADTSLSDLLGRLSLHYAHRASAMRTLSPLCSDRASTIQNSFLKSWFLCVRKNVNNFAHIVAWEVFQRWEVFINYHGTSCICLVPYKCLRILTWLMS